MQTSADIGKPRAITKREAPESDPVLKGAVLLSTLAPCSGSFFLRSILEPDSDPIVYEVNRISAARPLPGEARLDADHDVDDIHQQTWPTGSRWAALRDHTSRRNRHQR